MNDALDELERQLRHAVRTHAHTHVDARSTGGRARAVSRLQLRRGHKRTWAIVALAMLSVCAGALAATRLSGGQSLATQGREIALQAARETAGLPACRKIPVPTHGPALIEGTPLPQITRVLPALATPAPASEQAATLRRLTRARVDAVLLARTLRTITVTPQLQLLVAVGVGEGGETVREPLACAHARLQRAAMLDEHSPATVKRWARRRLAQLRDTTPGLQTLYLEELPIPLPPHELSGGGTADPITPQHPLEPGLIVTAGQPDGARLLIGIATPHATQIRLQSKRTATHTAAAHGHAPATLTPVHEGFYALPIPPGAGRFSLVELAADGHVLHHVALHR